MNLPRIRGSKIDSNHSSDTILVIIGKYESIENQCTNHKQNCLHFVSETMHNAGKIEKFYTCTADHTVN